jgi:flagellin-like protein
MFALTGTDMNFYKFQKNFIMFTKKRKLLGISNKKGISAIIATVILIALAVAAIAVIWVFVKGMVEDELGEAGACFEVYEKVTLNDKYTCYDFEEDVTLFSINIGDVEVDEILVGISAGGASKSFRIKDDAEIEYLEMWSSDDAIRLPEKNEGLTYSVDMSGAGLTGTPTVIQISPVIKGAQCEVSDSIVQIDSCATLEIEV